MTTRTDAAAAQRARQPAHRRAEEAAKAGRTARPAPKAKLKKDEFSTGRAKALRAQALAKEQAPGVTTVAAAQPQGAAQVTAAAAVTGPGGASAPLRTPVFSFDTATYLSVVGNPPAYRITQQQVDELKRLGMQHGVIGLGSPGAKDFAAQMAALHQEVTLLTANGIHTDVYSYLHWASASGAPKTDAQVKAELTAQLDQLQGQKVDTFWFDVEGRLRAAARHGSVQHHAAAAACGLAARVGRPDAGRQRDGRSAAHQAAPGHADEPGLPRGHQGQLRLRQELRAADRGGSEGLPEGRRAPADRRGRPRHGAGAGRGDEHLVRALGRRGPQRRAPGSQLDGTTPSKASSCGRPKSSSRSRPSAAKKRGHFPPQASSSAVKAAAPVE